ncbi:hypothetical protein [Helicobacter fennelliae]|uniref:hypothetical protein n=1 Tax=Helicobacter fennelliae TaxID=215 RepID=UPI0015EC4268|nr:hypothetical protein [Helicobacter fennelliae]
MHSFKVFCKYDYLFCVYHTIEWLEFCLKLLESKCHCETSKEVVAIYRIHIVIASLTK